MEDFGERLRKLRTENDISQEELAAKLGVSAQAVSKWERGRSTPDLSAIVPLAKLFRISTDRLLGNEGFRQDWDTRWYQAMLTGDPAGAVKIAQEAQQELPEIRHFLYRQAEAEAQLARDTEDPEEKQRLLIAAEQKLRDVVREFPEFESAALKLVAVLLQQGRRQEAETIARGQPNGLYYLVQRFRGSADEDTKRRAITGMAMQFFSTLTYVDSLPALDLAERFIRDFPWDAGDKAGYLSILCVYRARCLCVQGDLDGAMAALEGMREYMHPVEPAGEAEPLAFLQVLEPPAEDWVCGLRELQSAQVLKEAWLKPLEDREEFQALLRLAERHNKERR